MTEQQYQAHTETQTYQPHEIQTQFVAEPTLSEPEVSQDKGLLTKVKEGIQNVTSKLTWGSGDQTQAVGEPDHPQLQQNLVHEDHRTVGEKIKQGFQNIKGVFVSDTHDTVPDAPQMNPDDRTVGEKIKQGLDKITPETHHGEPDHPQLQQNLVYEDRRTVGEKVQQSLQSTKESLFPATQEKIPQAPRMGEDDRTLGDKLKEGLARVTPEKTVREPDHPQLGQNIVYEDHRTLGEKIKQGFQSVKESWMPESKEKIPVAPPLGEDNRTVMDKMKEGMQGLAPETHEKEPDHPQLGQNFVYEDNRSLGDKIKQGFQSTKAGLMPEQKIPDAPAMGHDDRTLGEKIKEGIHHMTPESRKEPDHPQLQQNVIHEDHRTVGDKIKQGFQNTKDKLIPESRIPEAPRMGEDDRTLGEKLRDDMSKMSLGTTHKSEPTHPQLGQNLVYDDHRSVGDKIMDKVVPTEVTSDGIPKVPEEQRSVGERMKDGFQSAKEGMTGETHTISGQNKFTTSPPEIVTYDRSEIRGPGQGTI